MGRAATPASYCFYLVTGLHAIHLLVGVGLLVGSIGGLIWLKSVQHRQIMVDATGWFWHAMGLCWVLLFLMLEFGQ
jgi:cytochrome c oxidase subunit 3